MTNGIVAVAFSLALLISVASSQDKIVATRGHSVGSTDLKAFADALAAGGHTEYEKARNIVRWLAGNFDWTATDYKQRTVEEIIARKGGNCNELARVTMALFKQVNIRFRKVQEINIHRESLSRRERAEEKIREAGNRMSVFGKRHNDHVWVEIYDENRSEWLPADPCLGLIGEREWLQARAGFGTRTTLDPSSEDMIVPMGIFATDDKGNVVEDRTRHYVIDGLNGMYGDSLTQLKSWKPWIDGVTFLSEQCRGAFEGRVNLHDYESLIDSLSSTYASLKVEFLHTTPAVH